MLLLKLGGDRAGTGRWGGGNPHPDILSPDSPTRRLRARTTNPSQQTPFLVDLNVSLDPELEEEAGSQAIGGGGCIYSEGLLRDRVGINETKVENADMGKDKEGEAISSGGEGGVSASFGQFHVDPEDGIDERSLNART